MCNHLSDNKIVYLMQSVWWLQVEGSSLLSWILSHIISATYTRDFGSLPAVTSSIFLLTLHMIPLCIQHHPVKFMVFLMIFWCFMK